MTNHVNLDIYVRTNAACICGLGVNLGGGFLMIGGRLAVIFCPKLHSLCANIRLKIWTLIIEDRAVVTKTLRKTCAIVCVAGDTSIKSLFSCRIITRIRIKIASCITAIFLQKIFDRFFRFAFVAMDFVIREVCKAVDESWTDVVLAGFAGLLLAFVNILVLYD